MDIFTDKLAQKLTGDYQGKHRSGHRRTEQIEKPVCRVYGMSG